jgi:hypothetical protein
MEPTYRRETLKSSLGECFGQIPDPRAERTRAHQWLGIINHHRSIGHAGRLRQLGGDRNLWQSKTQFATNSPGDDAQHEPEF